MPQILFVIFWLLLFKQVRDAALSMLHIKRHYFGSHPSLNALGIIPAGAPGESSQFSGPAPQHRLSLAWRMRRDCRAAQPVWMRLANVDRCKLPLGKVKFYAW
jgi:hypothetical protein